MRDLVGESLLESLRRLGPHAYLEQIARTDPHLFHKYIALLIPRPNPAADNRTLIQNILSPLPPSPLDALPPDFDIHR